MVKRIDICDTNRLRSYLDDDLNDVDQADLAAHLDHCANCQAALERLAAGTRIWDDLRGLGRSPDPVSGDMAAKVRMTPAGDGIEFDFLAPSDYPDSLGRLGPYEILGVLGQGGMGVVLKAFEPALSRVVAIKVLAPQMAASGAARRRFSREAKAAAAVVHDHVVSIHAVDDDPKSGLPYLVMPYIAGRSLQERIDRDGPLRTEEVLRIGMQTALGLAAAHAQGLVHRDIKPSNILLENGVERVKITDFGLARAIDDASRSQSGVVAGTPQYMSPEQAGGESVDYRSDLFSLGSVLYAMCAGHSPFRAKTTMGVLRRVCDEEPRALYEINPEVPESLEVAIARLHAKDPAGRYQSAAEVAEVLGRQLADLQRPGPRRSRPAPPPVSAVAVAPAPAAKPAGLSSDWSVARAKPRPGVSWRAAAVLLGVIGLGAAFMAARSAPEGPSRATLFASSSEGQPPGMVVISQEPVADPMIVGSGKPATKGFNLADFTGIEIAHPFRAEVTRGDRFAVSVTADDNMLEHVRLAKDGARLKIGLEDNRSYRFRRNALKVAITLPALEEISLTHGARSTIRGFESDRPFTANASHGSLLEGTVKVGRLVLEASHGSEVDLNGTAGSARLVAEHGSDLDLDELVVHDTEAEISHGATATIHAEPEKSLKAEVNHGGTLLGVVRGGTVELEAGHSAHANLKGSARSARIEGTFSSELSLGGLAVEEAEVQLGHASTATVNAARKLDYDLEFSSNLKYLGNPAIGRSSKSHQSSARAAGPDEGEKAEAANKAGQERRRSSRARWDGDELVTITLRSWGDGRHSIMVSQTSSSPSAILEGSGRAATKTVDLKDFTGIRLASAMRAEVTRADAFQVRITADDNILDHVRAVRDGSTLKLDLAPGSYRFREPPRVSIAMPALEMIDLSGASRATVQGFESDRPFRALTGGASTLEGSIKAGTIDVNADGASTLKLRGSAKGAQVSASGASTLDLSGFSVAADRLPIEANGASTVRLQGTGRIAAIKADGASNLDLSQLALDAADVEVSGASTARIRVKDLLNYDVSSASHLDYIGEPEIKRAHKDGVSSVTHRP